ncbi:enoyl-CoA hydratase [Rhodococcus hoagii]|nr:enoyl-CoA hydratase [Prescottella equi]
MTTESPPTPECLAVTCASGVATVTIDRPPANAFDPALIAELLSVLPPLAADPDVRCIVVRGTGRFFVAVPTSASCVSSPRRRSVRCGRGPMCRSSSSPHRKPVVAALNGHALGGGAELSLACDVRVMTQSATIGFPEMGLGLFPGAGGSQRLPRLLGAHRAKLLMIQGARLSATEALDIGLVDEVVPDDRFDSRIDELATELAAKPTRTIGCSSTSWKQAARLRSTKRSMSNSPPFSN